MHLPVPERALHWFTNLGWDPAFRSLGLANEIKKQLPSMPVITNGCCETLESIDEGLEHCDMVSMARALIANPELISTYLNNGKDVPERSAARAAIAVSDVLPPARSVAMTSRALVARIQTCSAKS